MRKERPEILLVEDNGADVFLLREAIEAAGVSADLRIISDGERAIDFIDQTETAGGADCPSLVILDLNLPKKTGSQVLEHLRRSPTFRRARVLVVTSSDSEHDRARAAELGADGYFRKPSAYEAFLRLGEVVRDMLSGGPLDEAVPQDQE